MSDKQAVMEAVGTLPNAATWNEITDALVQVAARRGTASDVANLYKTQLRAEDLAAYLNPTPEVSLETVLHDLTANDRP